MSTVFLKTPFIVAFIVAVFVQKRRSIYNTTPLHIQLFIYVVPRITNYKHFTEANADWRHLQGIISALNRRLLFCLHLFDESYLFLKQRRSAKPPSVHFVVSISSLNSVIASFFFNYNIV